MSKLWVDDMRDAPDDSWTVVRKVQPAISFLAKFNPTEISLDHDIEFRPDDETFKPIAYYIGLKYAGAERDEFHTLSGYPKITIHSDNPVGAKEMIAILKDNGLEAEWHPYTSESDFKTKYGLT